MPVECTEKTVVVPTYEPQPPDRNPMCLEKRVYQGSSGAVYPLPVYNRIASETTDREWRAIFLENEFVEVMILPQIGVRIHAANRLLQDVLTRDPSHALARDLQESVNG